jgi:hypothetical protein
MFDAEPELTGEDAGAIAAAAEDSARRELSTPRASPGAAPAPAIGIAWEKKSLQGRDHVRGAVTPVWSERSTAHELGFGCTNLPIFSDYHGCAILRSRSRDDCF